MPNVIFKKFTANSFQGINKENPVIIDFTEYADKKIMKLSGDQGTRKTSTIHALLYALAQAFDFNLSNFINLDDKTLNENFEFESDKVQYRVIATKSKFTLERHYRDADSDRSGWIPESSPKELTKKLIGHVAISPMHLKEAKGEDQIKWLYATLKISQEIQDEEAKLKLSFDTAEKARTKANNEYERIEHALSEEPLYIDWEQSERTYSEIRDMEAEQKKVNDLMRESGKYDTAVKALESFDTQITDNNLQIEELKKRIQALEERNDHLATRKTDAKKFISENATVKEDFQKALKDYSALSRYHTEQSRWNEVKRRKSEMDQFQDAVIKLDAQKLELKTAIKELVKKALPDIPGLEVVTQKPIDDTVSKPVGFYVDGKSPAQLSESELFKFYFQIAYSQDITLVIVENMTSLGSSAIKALNMLAKKGVYVWGTEMDRSASKMSIKFIDEII